MRRSCWTISRRARARCCRASRRSPGGQVPCVDADVRDIDALRARVSRPSDHRRRPLRGAQGGRRVRGAAARVLRRQRRRRLRAGRGDGRGRRRDARVQLVGHRLRPAGRAPGHRGRAAARRRASTGAPSAIVEDFLRDLARANPNWRIAVLRYFNPAGAHSVRPDRRGADRTSQQPRAAAVPDRRRRVLGSRDLRDRLADVRRHRRPRLPARAGSRGGPRRRRCAISPRTLARSRSTWGSAAGDSVLDVVTAFERACGRRITRTLAPRRPGDVAAYYADPARAEKILGWRATRGLDAICADAWRWQQNGGKY